MDLSALMDVGSDIFNGFWPLLTVIGGLMVGFKLLEMTMRMLKQVGPSSSYTTPVNYDALDDEDYGDDFGPWEDEPDEPVIQQVPEWETFCHYCGTGFTGDEKQCKHCYGKRQQLSPDFPGK